MILFLKIYHRFKSQFLIMITSDPLEIVDALLLVHVKFHIEVLVNELGFLLQLALRILLLRKKLRLERTLLIYLIIDLVENLLHLLILFELLYRASCINILQRLISRLHFVRTDLVVK